MEGNENPGPVRHRDRDGCAGAAARSGPAGRARQFEVLTANDVVPPQGRRRAVDLIIETLLNAREKITLVPVGPLTNIALALKTEPRIKEKIERIVLMGGAFAERRPEYNIRRDRIAADIVSAPECPLPQSVLM